MNAFEKLVKAVEVSSKDAVKFYDKGNKAAGVRLRKAMMGIKALTSEVRKEVTDWYGKEDVKS